MIFSPHKAGWFGVDHPRRPCQAIPSSSQVIFSTRFECFFTSSPLVSSVFSLLPHSFRVCFCSTCQDVTAEVKSARGQKKDSLKPISKNTLETGGEDEKHTRNEWRR
jgi:hypothetical protein